MIVTLDTKRARELVVMQFRASVEGQMDSSRVERAAKRLLTLNAGYAASANFLGAHAQVFKTGGKPGTFNGDFAPAGILGGYEGHVYTDDESRLLNPTPQTFNINIAVVYCSVLFFDAAGELVGHFQGGGLGFAVLVGGGQGSWA